MKFWMRLTCGVTVMAVVIAAASGCRGDKNKKTTTPTASTPSATTSATTTPVMKTTTATPPKTTAEEKKDHPTKGPHGGPLAEWGEEEIHVELVVDAKTKQLVIYLLDDKAKGAAKVDPTKVTDVKAILTEPKLEVDLKHDAKLSGDKGIAFVSAPNDAFAKAAPFAGSIRGKVGEKEYKDDFTIKASK